jgi:hypothetical protein
MFRERSLSRRDKKPMSHNLSERRVANAIHFIALC